MFAEELQLAGTQGITELLKEQPPEQPGEHAHGQEEARRQATQRCPSSDRPPPGTIPCT